MRCGPGRNVSCYEISRGGISRHDSDFGQQILSDKGRVPESKNHIQGFEPGYRFTTNDRQAAFQHKRTAYFPPTSPYSGDTSIPSTPIINPIPPSLTLRYLDGFVRRCNVGLQGVQAQPIYDCLGPFPVPTHLPPTCALIVIVSLTNVSDKEQETRNQQKQNE